MTTMGGVVIASNIKSLKRRAWKKTLSVSWRLISHGAWLLSKDTCDDQHTYQGN